MLSQEEIKEISQFFKVISAQSRLNILYLLKKQPLNVSEIVEQTGLEQSAISHQLRILKDARLVRSHREGKLVIYQLDDEHVFDILEQVKTHINEELS